MSFEYQYFLVDESQETYGFANCIGRTLAAACMLNPRYDRHLYLGSMTCYVYEMGGRGYIAKGWNLYKVLQEKPELADRVIGRVDSYTDQIYFYLEPKEEIEK